MTIFRFIVVSTGVFTIVGGFYWLSGNQSTTAKNSDLTNAKKTAPVAQYAAGEVSRSTQDSKLLELEAQVKDLNHKLRLQQHELKQQSEQITQLFLSLESTLTSSENTELQSQQSDEVVEHETVSLLETEISNQSMDEEWSITAVDQIMETLTTETFTGSILVDANCRVTLCRIEMEHEDETTLDSFMENFSKLLGWEADAHTEIINNEDGTIMTVVHISREDYSLPKPET